MALITIERILPATVENNILINSTQQQDSLHNNVSSKSSDNILNEIYIAVRGADIIFPYNECHRFSKSTHKTILNDIQKHLQAIFKILRLQDTIKMAVRLESQLCLNRTRYLLVVSNETDQSCLLGIDYENEATIGLVLPIWNDMQITLDGDGGFRITSGTRHHIFKPVSVQAMWSAFQALHLATKKSIKNNYFEGGGSHSWISYYQNSINSNSFCLHEWHTITDSSETTNKLHEFENKPKEQLNFEELITVKLKKVMMSVDLEQITSKEIRNELEAHFQRDLTEFKSYIDKEMIRIMGQMEEASKILDYLYLGSEWNASNFEELKGKGVKKILNVTCEIDNFFPGYFEYHNIRVDDDEGTDMLRYLNDTYYYIRKAKDEGVKVLVHCKKGISRSASVVVAYIMKEKSCDLYEALEYVKNHRSNIRPNPEFLKQLEIYQGMLNASNNKNNIIWRSRSESNLFSNSKKTKSKHCDDSFITRRKHTKQEKHLSENKENAYKPFPISYRRRSWPPKDSDSSYVLFDKKDNKVNKRKAGISSDSCFYLNDKDLENLENICKFERKSRVKERIDSFENNKQHPTNNQKNMLKKNLPKNGLVSNLACQFESKDKKEVMDDLSNLEQFQRNAPTKPSKNDEYEQVINEFKLNLNDSTKLFKSIDNNYEYSNRMKRTRSYSAVNRNYHNLLIKQRHFKSAPLDLHYFQEQLQRHSGENNFDGFVKRRTEELEKGKIESTNSHKSLSVPSSPNFTNEQHDQRNNDHNVDQKITASNKSGQNSQLKYSHSSKSFDFYLPSINKTISTTNESVTAADKSKKNLKKTYGKNHPLDILNRNNNLKNIN